MLLALEKTFLPAEYSTVGLTLWESNSGLLQKNRGDEEKPINFEKFLS